MDHPNLNEFICQQMPHFLALNYRQAISTLMPEDRVRWVLHTYDLLLRLLTVVSVSQYLLRDREDITDPRLNELLLSRFPRFTLDGWQQILFATLQTYEGKRELLFIEELYDVYWDSSVIPHRRRHEAERAFERLTQISMELRTNGAAPRDKAEWEALAQESLRLLQCVFTNVAFLGDYDLIRILDHNEDWHEYALHKGDHISVASEPLPENVSLNRGWFYLRKSNNEFLLMHPMLVFWEEEQEGMPAATDVGIYDRVYHEYGQLGYLLAVLGKTFVSDADFEALVQLLYGVIEQEKQKRLVAEKLTWWQLRDLSASISQQRMSTTRLKYQSDLYLQRTDSRRAFDEFLKSDKSGFVLIGPSGVGKSSFLIALSEELQSRDDISILMYDGAYLRADPSLTEVISRDFDKRLTLAGQSIRQIWQEIAKIEGIAERLVILCVDAINESPDAKDLLRQVDELVQDPWPWLKVVVSSRPETWQVLKRGIKLSEAMYFREQDSERSIVQLEPLTYSAQLGPFSYDELPQVYANYVTVFGLKTPYEALGGELREILRDPFSLWLVAKSYEEQSIPARIRVAELVEMHLQALLRSQKLHPDDLRFLEKQLVPLFARQGQYSNAISLADINAADEALYAAIYSEQILSDGRRLNQSYANLVDHELLVRQGEGLTQRIAFKYERFYEYFIGKALFQQLGPEKQWERHYQKWVGALPQTPYLWGAIKACLIRQIQELSTEDCVKLCIRLTRSRDQRLTEAWIAALTEYGYDEPGRVQEILRRLLSRERHAIWIVLRRRAVSTQCPVWKRVAIEVASNLEMAQLIEFALIDPSSSVRAVTVRHAFLYWQREPESCFGLLERLLEESIGPLGLPALHILESCVGLSLLILFEDFSNVDTKSRLRRAWRPAIERLLHVNPSYLGTRREHIKEVIRVALVRIVAGFVLRIASEAPSTSNLSGAEGRQYFKRDRDLGRRRTIARQLVKYMNAATTEVDDFRDFMLGLVHERDFWIAWLAITVIQRHMIVHPQDTLRFIKELFEGAIEVAPPGPFSLIVPFMASVAEGEFSTPESRELHLYMLTAFLDRCQGKWWSELRMRRITALDSLSFFESGDYSSDAPLGLIAGKYVDEMVEDRDYAWITDLIHEATAWAVEAGRVRLTLDVLERLLGIRETSIGQDIVESLARIRVYYPDEVDSFLAANDLDENFVAAVRERAPSETIGDLLSLRVQEFLARAVVRGSDDIWGKMTKCYERIVEARSAEEAFALVFKLFANEIYGDSLFTIGSLDCQ